MNQISSLIDINFSVDANSYYKQIRQLSHGGDCFWDPKLEAWIIFSNKHCRKLIKDKALSRGRLNLPNPDGYDDLSELVTQILSSQFMFDDYPSHGEGKLFFSQVLQKFASEESSLCVIADELMHTVINDLHGKEIDVYSDFLQPIVSYFICNIMGIGTSYANEIYPYIVQYVRFLDGKISNQGDLVKSYFAIVKLYSDLQPFASRFYQRQAKHEDISNYLLVLAAGHESIAYALSTIYLSKESCDFDKKALIDDDYEKIIDEALRFDSPVQMMGRRATSDFSIGKNNVVVGDKVFLHIGMANRDPSIFEQPHVFDPSRSQREAIAFGIGNSHCIGSLLAKKATLIFLKKIRNTTSEIVIDFQNAKPSQSISGRGYDRLPGRISTARSKT